MLGVQLLGLLDFLGLYLLSSLGGLVQFEHKRVQVKIANLSFLGLLNLEGGLSAFLGSLGDDFLGTFLALLKLLDMFLGHPLLVLLLSLDRLLEILVSLGQLFDHAVHFLISSFLGPFELFQEKAFSLVLLLVSLDDSLFKLFHNKRVHILQVG